MTVRSFLGTFRIASRAIAIAILPMLAALTLLASGARGAPVQSSVDHFMVKYTRELARGLGKGAHIDYSIPALADRPNLSDCPQPLTITPRDPGQLNARLNLQVSCGDAWSLYVPVDLDIYRPVVAAVKPLAPGTVIGSDDVELVALDVTQLVGTYLISLDDAIGMGVKRSIGQGRPVISQQLEPPLLIRRGEAVTISAEASSLAVKMPGIALTDGHRGEQIRIRNQASSRVVDARVIAPGQVVVSM